MKKWISLLLAAVLVLGMGPLPVQAAGTVISSGVCGAEGDNLTWTLDNSGLLTISGTGAMEDFYTAPWYGLPITRVVLEPGVTTIGKDAFSACSNLNDVQIPDSVTAIGMGAFSWCKNLTDIQIPAGVTAIGSSAFHYCTGLTGVQLPDGLTAIEDYLFAGCTGLTAIEIPAGVVTIGNDAFNSCTGLVSAALPAGLTTIGERAFRKCESLTGVTFPDSVTAIGADAFRGCNSLTTVSIPAGVTTIGSYAFSGCTGLTAIAVDPGNAGYTSDDRGVMFDKQMQTLIQAPGGISGTYTIPAGVTAIGDEAFVSCGSLTDVVIPGSVETIGACAFDSCLALTEVTIPAGVTTLGSYAFCDCSALVRIAIADTVTGIRTAAFEGCYALTDVYYGGTEEQWEQIQWSFNNDRLREASIHFGTGTLPPQEDPELPPDTEPEPQNKCGDNVTWSLSDDGVLTISGTGPIWDYPVEYPGWYQDVAWIRECVIEEGVTAIGAYTFYSSSNLTAVTIPASVTDIGTYAFYFCERLTDVYYGGTQDQWSRMDRTFGNEQLDRAAVHCAGSAPGPEPEPEPEPGPGGGCGISESEVYDAMAALQAQYPEGMPWDDSNRYVWNINHTTGYGCAAFAFILSDAAFGYLPSRTVYDDITIHDLRVGDILRMYDDTHSAVVLEVHADHVVLAEGNFNGAIHWGRIYTAEEVARDTDYFHTRYPEHDYVDGVCTKCGALEDSPEPDPGTQNKCGDDLTWSLSDDGVLTISGTGPMWDFSEMQPGWYQDRDRITTIVVAEGVTAIGQEAFTGCRNLTNAVIGEGATVIRQGAFRDCESLVCVAIPVSVTYIEDDAFSGCFSLTDFHYGGTVTEKAEISIGWNNACLTYADLHEESAGPGPDAAFPDPTPPLGTGCGMNETAVFKLLMDQKASYPEGMSWTNSNSYHWNINNTTGYGCAAFAFLLSDTVFGYLPARRISENITIDDLRVGDIVRMYNDGKSAVVLKVYDDYAILAEGSYNGTIHWGRIYTAEEVERDTTYIYTRYPEHTFADGVCTECGAPEATAADPGDSNGDGEVNGLDLILLRQYLANWDVSPDPAGADADGNGTINGLDLILLRQYLAGWDVTLGP